MKPLLSSGQGTWDVPEYRPHLGCKRLGIFPHVRIVKRQDLSLRDFRRLKPIAADKLGDEGITSQINDFDNLANDGRNNSGNNDDTGKNDNTRNNAGNYGYGNGSGYDSNNNQGNTNGKPRFDEIDDFEKL